MRRHWIDNLRWCTVLAVMLYHIVFMFNNKGVLGGIGGFVDDPMKQPQDIIMYILYPWFMMLMFLIAGISARYSLEKRTTKEFVKSRSLKLLVPSIIGLFVYHWITGYFTIQNTPAQMAFSSMPSVARWISYSTIGSGPLWFVHDLWAFSMLLVVVRKLDSKDRFRTLCSKASIPVILLMGILIYLGSQVMISNPNPQNASDGLINLYRPIAYFVPFLLGYFVFSNDSVLDRVKRFSLPISVCAIISCIAFCLNGWGENMTSPHYLTSWLNCLYAWLMMLAMIGLFMRLFDKTTKFSNYMTRISFGLYVLHYSVVVSFAYLLKTATSLSPFLIYLILTIIVFVLTPLIYEILHRIPFVRWAVLGEKKK